MAYQIIKRTFEASNYPEESTERKELNKSALTSEYFKSFKYILRRPFFMSDGSLHPQKWMDDEYKTAKMAREDALFFNYGDEIYSSNPEALLIK